MVTRKRKLVAPESPFFQVPEATQVHEDGGTESVLQVSVPRTFCLPTMT